MGLKEVRRLNFTENETLPNHDNHSRRYETRFIAFPLQSGLYFLWRYRSCTHLKSGFFAVPPAQ